MSFLDWLNFFGWNSGTMAQVQQEIERRAKLHSLLVHEVETLTEALENPPTEGNLKIILHRAKTLAITARSPL